MLLDHYTKDEIASHVGSIMALIRAGRSREVLYNSLSLPDAHELVSIAVARIKDRKVKLPLLMNEDDLRFATNNLVATWRAKRLSCKTIIEIGCGIGVQSIAFAKTCAKVIAIDTDARKIRYAVENAKMMGVSNITFLCSDGVTFLESLPMADTIFVDPQRLASEPVRSVETMQPSISQLLHVAKQITNSIAIELPPQVQLVPLHGEREYASVDHELNRLTVYNGDLKHVDVSVVVLPSGDVLASNQRLPQRKRLSARFVYEPDPAVVKAGLIDAIDIDILDYSGYTLFGSDNLIDSPFCKNIFKVLYRGAVNLGAIKSVLQDAGIGKVVLRTAVSPQDYWKQRKIYESDLKGSKIVHLFLFDEALVCEKIN
ncbi:MAG: methyltransferase domain-containing protein [Nanoarchaeota archaeon]